MKPRQLTADFSFLKVVPTVADRNVIDEGYEWQFIDTLAGYFYNEQVIDLTGMAVEQRTFFPESFNVQIGPVHYLSPGNSGAGALIELHFVTTSPFDVRSNYTQGDISFEQFQLFPGSIGSLISFDNVVCGEWVTYTSSTSQLPALEMYPSSSGRFGSMEPVASDRLYCYKVVISSNIEASANSYGSPSSKIVLFGQEAEESDLAYVMRLRRDYILQQEPDED